MRSKFLVLLMVVGLTFLSLGTAQAATSAIDNMPGGAGVFFWSASPAGQHTLLNIQNVADNADVTGVGSFTTSVVVHIVFYDRDSNHLFDINCPLSPRDNWGAAITGDGTTVTLTPWPSTNPIYSGTVNGVTNCTAVQTFVSAGNGSDNMQYGYGIVAIDRVDAAAALGRADSFASYYRSQNGGGKSLPKLNLQASSSTENNSTNTSSIVSRAVGDGDARQSASFAGRTVVLPDFIYVRTAILDSQTAYAFNGNMIQGFLNMSALQTEASHSREASTANGVGWMIATGPDVLCGAAAASAVGGPRWSGGTASTTTPTALTDQSGVEIHAPELYITDNVNWGAIILGTNPFSMAEAAAGVGNSPAAGVCGTATGAAGCGVYSQYNAYYDPAAAAVCAAATRMAPHCFSCQTLRGGRMRAFGAAEEPGFGSPTYWARYNSDPAAGPTGSGGTATLLISVAPATSATANNPASAIADTRTMTINVYDDQEGVISVNTITPPEVGMSPFRHPSLTARPGNSEITHSTNTSGEARIQVGAPLFGYTYTINMGIAADLYPLVVNRKNVNVFNLYGASIFDDTAWHSYGGAAGAAGRGPDGISADSSNYDALGVGLANKRWILDNVRQLGF